MDKFLNGGYLEEEFTIPYTIFDFIVIVLFPPIYIIVKEYQTGFKSFHKIIYSIILTGLGYFPGLIYSIIEMDKRGPIV